MKIQQTPKISEWALTEATVARRILEEGYTLLVVKAVYPLLVNSTANTQTKIYTSEEGAARFNACSEGAAEAFVAGGLQIYSGRVTEEFSELSHHEKNGFLRRELICCMNVVRELCEMGKKKKGVALEKYAGCDSGTKQTLTVDVQVTYGTRRQRQTLSSYQERLCWIFPEGILEKNSKKLGKTIEKM